MHEGVWLKNINFWQNDSYENLDNYSLIWLLFMHSAYTGQLTPTTAFDGAIWYFADTI